MTDDKARIALIGLTVVFLAILAAFRKKVTYPFCTLEKYSGKVNKGKSSYFLIFHFFVSLGLGIASYVLLNKVSTFNAWFEDTAIRLSTILLFWLFWTFVLGLLIEFYLQATDKEYKDWKATYLQK